MKPVKVKELIAELQTFDPELECIFSIDEEGNSFNKVYMLPTLGKLEEEGSSNFISDDDEEYTNSKGEIVVCIN